MNVLNAILAGLTRLLMAPFMTLPAWVALVFWSAVAGVLMSWAFRYTSNQAGLKRAIDQIRANMLGMKLFKDDLRVTLRCQGALFRGVGLRLWHSLPPMLVMIIPFVLILTHLAAWYEYRPFHPGESFVVELALAPDAWSRYREVNMEPPPGLVVEAPRAAAGVAGWPGLPDAGRRVLNWRMRAEKPDPGAIKWTLASNAYEKTIVVAQRGDRPMRVCKRRPGPGFEDRLINAGESGFDSSSPIQSIEIPPGEAEKFKRVTPIFGLNIPWWGTFLVVSMLAAFVAKPFLKVQF